MSKLYIVEGLPCSGKSSTARYIAELLTRQGCTVRCVDEGEDHPADYVFHALVDGQVIPLANLPPEEQARLLPRKIYDGLPWETEAPLMLDKWRQFVREADPGTTYVFNCVLLQNPMCETMMRFGMTEAESSAHIRQIAEIIAPLEPTVVYLHTQDIAAQICRTALERPGWLDAVIPYHVEGSYGKSIGAQGFDGYIACLTERQKREERILHDLPLHVLVLDDPCANWAAARDDLALRLCQERT